MDPASGDKGKQPLIPKDNNKNAENTESSNEEDDTNWETYNNFMEALENFPMAGQGDRAIQLVFDSLPSTDMETQTSSSCTSVPDAPNFMISTMLDMNLWALRLTHVVRLLNFVEPPLMNEHWRSIDKTIVKILLISAEFQLPTPLLQRRKFQFYRIVKEFDTMWVIFDISIEYFLHSSADSTRQNLWRRQSGVIVFKDSSKVYWLEHVQGPSLNLQDNQYSGLINSNLGFSAQRWLDTMIWWFLRRNSTVTINKRNVNAQKKLLLLADRMKTVFVDIVSPTPNGQYWVTLSNHNVKVMRAKIHLVEIHGNTPFTAVTTFRLEATPSEVYEFLIGRLVEIKWPPSGESSTEHEEILKCESESNHITLLKKGIDQKEFSENPNDNHHYLVLEASSDGLCNFVVAAPISRIDAEDVICSNSNVEKQVLLYPSGFAILPDGLNSESSLVTVVGRQLVFLSNSEDDAIEPMTRFIDHMVQAIQQDMCSDSDCSPTDFSE